MSDKQCFTVEINISKYIDFIFDVPIFDKEYFGDSCNKWVLNSDFSKNVMNVWQIYPVWANPAR